MKKGFTLIELLAVIIILAVIALIATPVVLNVVENARKEAAENSAYGIIDAAKYVYTDSLLDGDVQTAGNAADLKVSGTPATSGTWNLNTTTGKVTLVDVVVGEYKCNGSNDDIGVTCVKGNTGGDGENTTSSDFFSNTNDGTISFNKSLFAVEDDHGNLEWNVELLQNAGWYDTTTLNIPSDYNGVTITTIGKFDIWDISDNLRVVNVPGSVTSFSKECCQLDNLTWNVSNSLTFIGSDAFYDSSRHTMVYDGTSESFKNNVTIEDIFSNILGGIPQYIKCSDGEYNTDKLYEMRDILRTEQVVTAFKEITGQTCDMNDCDGTLKQLEEAAGITLEFE